jgi:hypothetical protein
MALAQKTKGLKRMQNLFCTKLAKATLQALFSTIPPAQF